MRMLTNEEMLLIAGGHDPDNPEKDIDMPRVIIEGTRPRNPYDSLMWSLLLERLNYEPPNDSLPDHEEKCFINNDDPLLKNQLPQGTDLEDMRQAALMVADYIKGQPQNIEHGALLIRDASGNIRVGQVNVGTAGAVNMSADLRPGDKVVGSVHSHPFQAGVDGSLPSTIASNGAAPNDERNTMNAINAGFMDPNALIYVIDNATGQMHEYDPFNISAANRNNITNDLQQYGYDCSN